MTFQAIPLPGAAQEEYVGFEAQGGDRGICQGQYEQSHSGQIAWDFGITQLRGLEALGRKAERVPFSG